MNIIEIIKKSLLGQPEKGVETAVQTKVVEQSYESLKKLKAIVSERSRLRKLKDDQLGLAPSLNDEIADLQRHRIELMTEALIEDDNQKSASAAALDEQIQGKNSRLSDIEHIVAGIDKKIADLDGEVAILEPMYRNDLGSFFDGIYANLAEEYGQKGSELVELIHQITALRNVMIRHRAGKAGYVDSRFFLPGIIAGNSQTQNPMIDASIPAFAKEVSSFEACIQEQLMQAGFSYSFR